MQKDVISGYSNIKLKYINVNMSQNPYMDIINKSNKCDESVYVDSNDIMRNVIPGLMSTYEIKNTILMNDRNDVISDKDVYNAIIRNPELLKKLMKIFDMKWSSAENEYEKELETWSLLYDEAVKQNVTNNVAAAVYSHYADMVRVRCDGSPQNGVLVNPLVNSSDNRQEYTGHPQNGCPSDGQSDDWVDMEKTYDAMNDISGHPRRVMVPQSGECALLCGYLYPGMLLYTVGVWNGGRWDSVYDHVENVPEFVVTYWKRIVPPEGAVEKI